MDLLALIEIPLGSNVKYEIDEETKELVVDRFLFTSMYYPFNYGFIKNTKGEDGDPLDVCIFSSKSVQAGTVIKCHPIGLLEMEDEAGIDTKVIAVPDKKIDPFYGAWESIDDLPESIRQMTKHFFDHMKELEPGKWVKTGDYKSKEEAIKLIERSLLR